MELSPKLYQWIVRPDWYNKRFTNNVLNKENIYHKKVLDFGCGVGSNSFLCKAENYLGIDTDKNRIKQAKRNYPDYNFANVEKVELNENSFDLILIIAVLHHIPSDELEKIVEDFKKILRPNGEILVIEPCYYNHCTFNNHFMSFFDKGKFIRSKEEYFRFFQNKNFKIKSYRELSKLLYKEIFFSVSL
ncbi:class I SAM-dependent methyltransferase [Natronospora cellulosivora (SeqCode)]